MYHVIYAFSEDTYAYSYSAINTSDSPIEITINAADQSKNMLYLPSKGIVTKVIQPGEIEFLMHAIADTSFEAFTKKVTVNASHVY